MNAPLRILVLDASPTGDAAQARIACLLHDASAATGPITPVAQRVITGRDGAGTLAPQTAELLAEAGWDAPDLVVPVIGPGSFTGLRTACALAAGLAAGSGCAVAGVTRGEALTSLLNAARAAHHADDWLCVTVARRDRWFVESSDGRVVAVEARSWSLPGKTWLLAGQIADIPPAVAGRAILSDLCDASVEDIARAGLARWQGDLPPRAALPLYVDAPEAKLPAAGLRPSPS